MFNINELNEYVDNFGAVIKKLDELDEVNIEINKKLENTIEAQIATDKAMKEQWEKTIPLMDAQIKELKDMVGQIENAAEKQERAIKSMNDSLENTVKVLDLKFEAQKQELLSLKNEINSSFSKNINDIENSNKMLERNMSEQQNELQTNQGKFSKLQIAMFIAVLVGIVLDIILKFV